MYTFLVATGRCCSLTVSILARFFSFQSGPFATPESPPPPSSGRRAVRGDNPCHVHASRRDRPGITAPVRLSGEQYSREELTAERRPCIPLRHDRHRSAGAREPGGLPTPGWLRHIRDGSAADVILAAADAQWAADFLTGNGGGRLFFFGRRRGRACSRWSLQNIALVLCGVRDRRRPRSVTAAPARRSHHRLRPGHARGCVQKKYRRCFADWILLSATVRLVSTYHAFFSVNLNAAPLSG